MRDYSDVVVVKNIEEYRNKPRKRYLVALPSFPGSKGFNCRTTLVSAVDEEEAREIVRRNGVHCGGIGDIKEVAY